MNAAETVRRVLRWLHGLAHHYICIAVAVILVAVNILFFLAVSVICVMAAIDAMVTLLYQMAMPPTSGMSVVSVLLCAVATPWIVAFVATVMDWRHWPVWYRPLVDSLRAVSACCCGGGFVPLTAPTESFTLQSLLPRAGSSKCLGLVTAWRWLCGRRCSEEEAADEDNDDDGGAVDDDVVPTPVPDARISVQQPPSEQALLEPPVGAGPHSSQNHSFLDRVAEAKSGAMRAHLRIIFLYACPLVILIIATAVNFGATTPDTTEGTQLFIIMSALFAVLNAVVHLERWAVRPMQDSVRAFVIFRPEGRNISSFAVGAGVAAMLSILAHDSTMVRGGTPAAVAVVIVSALAVTGNVFVNLRRPGGFNRPVFQPRRSKYLRAIAVIDCAVLLAAAISIGAIFSTKDATLVWLLLGTVVVLHASVWVNDEKVQLQLIIEEQLDAEAEAHTRIISPQEVLQQQVDALDAQSRSLLLRSLRRGGARDLRRVGNTTFERAGDAPAGLEIKIDGVAVVVDAAHTGALEASLSSKELTYGSVTGAAAEEESPEESPALQGKKRQFRRFVLARRIAHSVVVFIALVIVGFTFVDGTSFYSPTLCGPGLYPGEGANRTSKYHVEYDVCGIRMSDFSIVDFAAAAAASYANNTTAAMQVYFPDEGAVGVDGAGATNAKAFIGVAYSVVRFPKRNATMVVIRGSYRSVDWLQNVYLMSDSLVLQLGTAMLPLPFSMALEATIVSLISSLKFGMSTYASSVLAAANRAQSRFPNDTIYIVGHSLGGFTANIVAAQGNFQGVAFSPMGTGMQYKRFGFPVRTADMTLLSIVPEHDLVPKVDVQLGMLQQIVSIAPCDFSNMFCHSMGLTMATLATNCGDPLGRTVGTCHSP